MLVRFRQIKEILTHPTYRPDQVIISRATSLPDLLQTSVAVLITLLSVPTLFVVSWGVEHSFFTATTFGWEAFGELALPLGSCILAAIVFLCRNPMHSLLSLLGVFFSTVLMYLIAGIAFVGLVFLIVYVGAVAVLFLFVIMLLNVKSLTSEDELIRHISQVGAIAGAILLLQQTHRHIVASLNRSMSGGFLRDAVVEPTTGEAVFFYVRFRAMDINALTGLYTLHAILFLVTTGILLAALLGAIILATVTTERATSIADIRQYSTKLPPAKILVMFGAFFVTTFELDLLTILSTSDLDLTSIIMSAPLYRVNDDQFIKNVKEWEYRTRREWPITDARYARFDRHVNLHRVTAHCALPRRIFRLYNKTAPRLPTMANKRRCIRFGGFDYQERLPEYKKKIHSVLSAAICTTKTRRALRRRRVFRLHASPALAPVMFKLLRTRNVGVLVRRRWLWRWRRDRAISRFRLDRDYCYSYPIYRTYLDGLTHPAAYFSSEKKTRYQSHWYDRELFAHPRISFRWSPIKYLRYLWSLQVATRIWWYSWRARAFSVMFFFYLPVVPAFTLLAYFFYEDYVIVFSDIAKVHKGMEGFWLNFDGSLDDIPVFTRAQSFVAWLLVFPAIYVVWILKFTPYIVGLSVLFAWDTVLMHGGEMSDIEFHESRCNYWRKLGWIRKQQEIDAAIALALVRSRRHPDKGYSDEAETVPAVSVWVTMDEYVQKLPTWASDPIYQLLNFVLPYYWWVEANILVPAYWYVKGVIGFIKDTQVYRCLSAIPRALLSTLVNKYPFLLDWYAAVIGFRDELARGLSDFAYSIWCLWCSEVWPYISRLAGILSENSPGFMSAYWVDRFGTLVLVYSVLFVTFLYSFGSLLILLQWKRVCHGTLVRRPPVLLPLAASVLFLYILFAYFPRVPTIYHLFHLDRMYSIYITYYYNYPGMWQTIYIYIKYPITAGWFWLVSRAFGWMTTDFDDSRDVVETYNPVMVRAYFNAWAAWGDDNTLLDEAEFEDELESFSSATDAYTKTVVEADEEDYEEYREDQAKLLYFNIVMHTYIPTYYDVHPQEHFRKYRYPGAFFSDKHHGNVFHSG